MEEPLLLKKDVGRAGKAHIIEQKAVLDKTPKSSSPESSRSSRPDQPSAQAARLQRLPDVIRALDVGNGSCCNEC